MIGVEVDRPAQNDELPEGMTRECLDVLEALFNERADVFDHRLNREFAVEAFKVVHDYLSQKGFG